MNRKTKKLVSLLDTLDALLDESTEMFIAERPFLWGEEVFDCENLEEREYENKLKIKKTTKAINDVLVKEIPVKTSISIQTEIY